MNNGNEIFIEVPNVFLSNDRLVNFNNINYDWDVNDFLENYLYELENLDFRLVRMISYLSSEERKLALGDMRVQGYLKKIILKQGKSWEFCDDLFRYIEFSDIGFLFDEEFINDFFKKNINKKEYILFASAFNNSWNHNEIIDIIIENDNLFNFFKENFNYFYGSVTKLDSEHFKKLLNKINETDAYNYFSSLIISTENAMEIIKDEYPVNVLYWLINMFPRDVVNEFFLNDQRAELMIPYLRNGRIHNFMYNDIKFGERIVKNSEFFEILKCRSLVDFRNTINNIEDHCVDPYYIEEKRKEYYDQLIKSYQVESGLFKVYEEILNDKDLFNKYMFGDSYLLNKDPYLLNGDLFRISNITRENLLRVTNNKLSELVVDALFYDSIYNVWINIKELLRFNSYLDDNEKTLSNDSIKFYKLILDIDSVPSLKKIELYNKLKDKNINQVFYDDIRKTKNLAYNKIKNKLIKPLECSKYENLEETRKNGVKTYDLRDKEFFMLVRCLGGVYNDFGRNRFGESYSIISNINTEVFLENDGIIYGYSGFDVERVIHMFEGDSFSTGFESKSNFATSYPNRISTIEQLANSSGYSEILLKNEKVADKEYLSIKPDFIVVIDEVNERSIEASKSLNIPIVIISKNKKPYIDRLPNQNIDQYTIGLTHEEERKMQR